MSKDLRYFLKSAKEAGTDCYVEVKKPIEADLEVCVIQQKLAKERRFPVIYCPEIKGSKLPLVTNLFGSYESAALALDMDPKANKVDITHEYSKREENLQATHLVAPSEAPVKEVILKGDNVDLGLLPITQHLPLDSGKYITAGSMICVDPDTGIPNAGIYRHEVKGRDKLSCRLTKGSHSEYIARRYAELGKPMEVVIFIGHHPAVLRGMLAKGNIDLNEFEVAGGLLGEPLKLTTAETVDVPVPAYAEIAIEGVIDPGERVSDGPFAEYTGYYGDSDDCYLLRVTAITMRNDAIYQDLDPSQQEHTFASLLGKVSLLYKVVKKAVPGVQAINLPHSGCNVLYVYISIKQRVPGEAKMAALAALAANFGLKLVVVVDDDIDVFDEEKVLWAIATRSVADEDIILIPRAQSLVTDMTSYDETRLKSGAMNTKIIVDATKPMTTPFPNKIIFDQELWKSIKLEDYL